MDLVVDQRDHVGVLDTDEKEKVMFGTGCKCGKCLCGGVDEREWLFEMIELVLNGVCKRKRKGEVLLEGGSDV